VGSDHAILVVDLAMELSQSFQVPAEVPFVTDTKIDRYIPSIKKAKNELGLVLKYSLKESINETVKNIVQIKAKL
jgi:dTDP-glucose 4,6-dehydratase